MTSKQIEQRARRLLSLGYNDSAASIARLAGDDLDGLRRIVLAGRAGTRGDARCAGTPTNTRCAKAFFVEELVRVLTLADSEQ